ncbi:MAG: hypothetical protein HY902_08310 [Deltaproteobacteria bacterium]|nr:hypothetical protein [Deltaproteobacteria bacterium]
MMWGGSRWTRRLASSAFALVWAWAALLGGCGLVWTDTGGPTGQCQTDNDCGLQGVVCYDHRVCIANTAADVPVSLRVAPPVVSGRLTEHFALTVQSATQVSPVSLMLADPAVVYGDVRSPDSLQPVSGTLVATAPTDATATSLQFQTTVYNAPKDFTGLKVFHDFELRLQPGNTYELAFFPQSSSVFPPHYSSITVGGPIDDWKITLPKAAELVHITGRLTTGHEPLGAVRVFLQDAQGRLTSTYDITSGVSRQVGADTLPPGTFRLLADPSAPPSVLRVEPATGSDWPIHGQLGDYLDIVQVGLKKGVLDLGTLELGGLAAPQTVQVQVLASAGTPELGAQVRLTQKLAAAGIDDAKIYLETSAISDSQGRIKVSLPPGPTSVIVQPAADSAAGRWFGTVKLQQGLAPITCPKRVVLTGNVHDYVDEAVPNATILLRKVGANPAESGVDGSKPSNDPTFQTSTDSDGSFSLPIDPGSWWLWVIPKGNAKLPRMLAKRVDIDGKSTPDMLLITIPAPMLLRGKVVTPSGGGVPNASVDVLGLQDLTPGYRSGRGAAGGTGDGDDPPGKTLLAEGHLLATTTTSSSGSFEVLIAPPK